MRNLFAAFVSNTVFANVAVVIVLFVGAMAAMNMLRENNPAIVIPFISVTVPYPGADPEEVEEGITQKVAAVVDGLEGVKRYTTSSNEGFSQTLIEVYEDADPDIVRDRVRNVVDTIDSFPADAEQPRVVREVETEEVISLAIWGDLPERQLKTLAEHVRRDLQELPELSQVEVLNAREYELSVEVPEETLRAYALTLSDVAEAIRRSSLNASAGTLRLEGEEIRLRTLGRRYEGPDFADVVVKALPEGDVVTLGQLATIDDTFVESERHVSFNGMPAVRVEVLKAPGEDSIAIADAVRAYVEEREAALPEGANITPFLDNTTFIDSQIRMLSMNGLLGLLLVLGILWLFLDTRLGTWVAMGIPTSLAGALIVLWLMGASLNQVSVVAMIIVMGIIVDDAIVVGEAIFVHRRMGKSGVEAAVDGVREVGLPVLASATTTIVANLPLAFVAGIFGQFVFQTPLVVITALLVSLVECLILLPAHLNHRTRMERGEPPHRPFAMLNRVHERVSASLERFVERRYTPFLRLCIRYRFVTNCAAIAIVLATVGLVAGGVAKFMMWPALDGDFIEATVEFPPGTPVSAVHAAVEQTRHALEDVGRQVETDSGEPLIKSVYTSTPSSTDGEGLLLVAIAGPEDRAPSAHEINVMWEEAVGPITGAIKQTFSGNRVGVGGQDIEFWLRGHDLAALRAAADDLKRALRSYDGVYGIADDFRPGKTEAHVTLKPAAHALGLSLSDVTRQLHAGFYGEEAVRIQRGREDVRVRVRYPEDERTSLSRLDALHIRTADGHNIPLPSVADLTMKEGVSSINGINGMPGVIVAADVDHNRAAPHEVVAAMTEGPLAEFPSKHPGVQWTLGGSEESNRETLGSLQRGFAVAMLGIFVILATMFRSYVQPLLIMAIIPFGIIGAIGGHILMGIPVTFLSLFGMVALAGVIVNSAIVYIECYNANIAQGATVEDSVVNAGVRRFRAIFLTSLSTVAGLTPLIMEKSWQAQIVIPMAVSLAAGVAFATVLTLILIPTFIVTLNDARRIAHRATRGAWPTPEQVEPALQRVPAEPA